MVPPVAPSTFKTWRGDFNGPTNLLRGTWRNKQKKQRSIMTEESDAPKLNQVIWFWLRSLDSKGNTRFKIGGRTMFMKYWSPVTAVPLSSESEEKMALVESEYFIGISSYHREQGFLMRSSQLLFRNQEIATNLDPWRTPSMKIKKILLRMNRILTKIQKMVVILVCLQGLGLGARAHLQYWLALNLFPNVV